MSIPRHGSSRANTNWCFHHWLHLFVGVVLSQSSFQSQLVSDVLFKRLNQSISLDLFLQRGEDSSADCGTDIQGIRKRVEFLGQWRVLLFVCVCILQFLDFCLLTTFHHLRCSPFVPGRVYSPVFLAVLL